jgi:predicted amidohydrolase
MICFDREHPESARTLMLEGAELIVVPNACDCFDAVRLPALQTRAYENMAVVAMANYRAPQIDGRSAAFGGVVYGEHGPIDPLLVQVGRHEGIYLAPFDLEELHSFRASETQADTYQKPYAYTPLSGNLPLPVFTRGDSRRSNSL